MLDAMRIARFNMHHPEEEEKTFIDIELAASHNQQAFAFMTP
jgi:hypothetical protein